MLHPVGWPNHGPQTELYLAEEAIGLVKSLDWNVVKGPMWDHSEDPEDEAIESDNEDFRDAFESGNPYTPKKNLERIK